MRILLLLLALNLGNVFKYWRKEGKDLGRVIADYVKKEPPYSEDYVMGLYITDLLSRVDSTERNDVYKALFENIQGECLFSDEYPDELKFISLRCYLRTEKPEKAEVVLKKLRSNSIKCMSFYILGSYYLYHGQKVTGEKYLKESIKKCRGVVTLWSRDLLFSKWDDEQHGR